MLKTGPQKDSKISLKWKWQSERELKEQDGAEISTTNDWLRRNLHLFVRRQNTSWVMKLPHMKAWSNYVITLKKKKKNPTLKHMFKYGSFF